MEHFRNSQFNHTNRTFNPHPPPPPPNFFFPFGKLLNEWRHLISPVLKSDKFDWNIFKKQFFLIENLSVPSGSWVEFRAQNGTRQMEARRLCVGECGDSSSHSLPSCFQSTKERGGAGGGHPACERNEARQPRLNPTPLPQTLHGSVSWSWSVACTPSIKDWPFAMTVFRSRSKIEDECNLRRRCWLNQRVESKVRT